MNGPPEGQQARTLQEFFERIVHFITPEGIEYAERFRPRPSDVLITTFPKAGTTWMQQIVHGLRTGGDMGFAEITEAVPWIELAHDVGWDLEAPQPGPFRAYKSHRSGDDVQPGCRYVVVVRDPVDTMRSFYDFMNGWTLERDAVSADELVQFTVGHGLPPGDYWAHLLSWWKRRHEPSVLMTSFEALKADLPTEVRRVARFVGLGDDEAAIEVATRQASFEFMKAHEPQFDDHLIAEARNAAAGLPADARSTKVRSGTVGSGRTRFSPATLELLSQRWAELVEPATGFKSYDELRGALARERGSD